MRKPKLLDLIPFAGCAHEFSWPRRWSDGDYYQVCLLCGAEYLYDWKTMRRTQRLEPGARRRFTVAENKRPTWSPRARRLKVSAELKYRARGANAWSTGMMQNISQSGVLFHGADAVQGDDVEMIFEMPKEIAGQEGRRVLCSGAIVRAPESKDGFAYAVSISYYRFLPRGRDERHQSRSESAD